jgi:ribosome maturation factor RimP
MDIESKKNASREIVEQIVGRYDAYVVDYKVNQQGNRTFVKVLVTTDHGIGLDQIAEISRAIRDDNEFNELFPNDFQLEVSSPGIDFPLKSVRDFRRNIGRTMNVFHRREDLKSPLKGKLDLVDDERLVLTSDNGSQVIQFTDVDFAKVIIQW